MNTKRSPSKRTLRPRYFLTYRDDPTVIMPGWVLYQNNAAKTPVGILPEPMGGIKNRQGRSVHQARHAAFITHAANTHASLVKTVKKAHQAAQTLARRIPKGQRQLTADMGAFLDIMTQALMRAKR